MSQLKAVEAVLRSEFGCGMLGSGRSTRPKTCSRAA